MKKRIAVATIVLLVVAGMAWLLDNQSRRTIAPAIYPQQITMLQSGSLSFEQQHGQILVWVVDSFRDSHVHVLQLEGMSEIQAVKLLETKQQELAEKQVELPVGVPAGERGG